MGKQDRAARENVEPKIIACQSSLLDSQVLFSAWHRSSALFNYIPIFAAGVKPIYTAR